MSDFLLNEKDFEFTTVIKRPLGKQDRAIVNKIRQTSTGLLFVSKKGVTQDFSVDQLKNLCKLNNCSCVLRPKGILEKHEKIVSENRGTGEKNIGNKTVIYIIHEFVPNGAISTIFDKINNGITPRFWTNDVKNKVLIGIAYGMKYLHGNNIIHGDLRPCNILLDKDYHPKVCDYVISYYLFTDATNRPEEIYYTAPEILRKTSKPNKKSDVFSFSILAYEIITGQTISGGKTGQEGLHRINIVNRKWRPNLASIPNPNLKALIEKCWCEDPTGRPGFNEILETLVAPDCRLPGTNSTVIDIFISGLDVVKENPEKANSEKERLERERLERERLERERLEQERLEKERLERERLERERLEQERLERERLEQERLEKERLERERLERERLEQERLEQERLERERLEQERLEKERLERERLERERLEQERLERERLERERLEQERLEKERLERERLEQERLERERLERERLERERLERERLEKERLERERLERERLEQERLERERLEQERLEKERLERERLERERLEQERLEQERLERERLEQERLEKERLERERLERERLEQERLERERLEQERLEKERLERERLEQERLERERLEQERLEKERLERERLERERLEQERLEQERFDKEDQNSYNSDDDENNEDDDLYQMLTVTYTYHPEKIIEIETKKESQFSVEADLMLTDSDSDNQDEKISNIDNKIPKYPPIPNTNIRNSYILKRKDATILSEDDLYSISKEKSSASVKHSHDETNEDTKDINHENDSEEVLLKKRAQSKTVKNHKTLPSPSPPSIINNPTNPPVTPPEGLPSDTHLNYPLFEVLHVYYVINDHEYDIPLNNALRTDLGTILTNSKNSTVYWKIEFRNRRKSGNISFSTKTKRNFLVKDQKNRYNWLDFPGQAETFTVMTRASQMKAGKIKLSGKVFNPENVTECYRIKASFILKKM